jgi:hypothetical protein
VIGSKFRIANFIRSLRSPEHVYEVFRMMSVCASVRLSVPLFVLPQLLKNALTDAFKFDQHKLTRGLSS